MTILSFLHIGWYIFRYIYSGKVQYNTTLTEQFQNPIGNV